jgi:NitT/TauT family transport system permease protein
MPKHGICTVAFILANALCIATLVAIMLPGKAFVEDRACFMVTCGIIQVLFIWRYLAKGKPRQSVCWVANIVWVVLLAWEICSTKLKLLHPVLFPLPENVFFVFPTHVSELTQDIASSLVLLGEGFFIGVLAGVLIGLFVGWLPKVREAVYPIAHVLAPVPAIVFAPYLVMLMPNFQVAAATIIFLGIFWPTLLNTIIRVESIDRHIIDSARMLGLSTHTMILRVLLPYMYPSIVSGLKTQLPAAMMMLTFAEMFGATSGLGYFIINYTNYANYTNVVAGIILVGVVVTVLDCCVDALQRKTVRWH